MRDGCVIPRDALFVPPRFVPNNTLLVGLGAEADADGWVTVDATGRTTVAGVWAAGNVVDPRAQVITAAGAALRGRHRAERRPGRGRRAQRRPRPRPRPPAPTHHQRPLEGVTMTNPAPILAPTRHPGPQHRDRRANTSWPS